MQYWYSPTKIESSLENKLEKAGLEPISKYDLDENIQSVLLIYLAPNQILEQKRLEESTATTCTEMRDIYEEMSTLSQKCKDIASSWRLNLLDKTSISRLCNGEHPRLDKNISMPSLKPLTSLLTLEIAKKRPEIINIYLSLELKSYLFGLEADINYLQRLSQSSLIDLVLMDWWEVNLEREASFEEVKNNLNQLIQIQKDCDNHIANNQRLQKSVKKQRAKIALLSKENKELKELSAQEGVSNNRVAQNRVDNPENSVEIIQESKIDKHIPTGYTIDNIFNGNRLFSERILQRFLRLLGRKSQ